MQRWTSCNVIQYPKSINDLGFKYGGKGGIRTRGGLLTHTRFPGVRLKPLIHLSAKAGVYQAGLLKPLASS